VHPHRQIEAHPGRGGCLFFLILAVILLACVRAGAGWVIDYQWWKEMGQVETWLSMLAYGVVPAAGATVISFVIFWIAHARGMKHARVAMRDHTTYARLATLALLGIALILALATMDTWTVVRYFGGRDLGGAAAWHDPVFGMPLAFYLFRLPFYSVLLRLVLGIAVIAGLLYWLTARGWQLRDSIGGLDGIQQIDLRQFRLSGALESKFLRGLGAIFLLALAVRFFLSRYDMLLNDHGFMVGIDYVNENVGLPLQWFLIATCILSAVALSFGKFRIALVVVLGFLLRAIVPPIVSTAYVRPNEISIEKPYIQRHIEATRSAFALDRQTREIDFEAKPQEPIDVAANKPLLDNVRLWDWQAFHETVSQIQPLRPYVYSDTDVDRYTIGGQYRQVLLSPRELDLSQLGDARTRWINPHFIYTHGYGVVMAEANKIAADGLPVLFIRDAPPVITVPGLKLAQPDLYYGEVVHDPVFVHTAQLEFDYPAGEHNVNTHYEGNGGFPVSSLFMRMAAAVSEGDWNILLTSYLTPDSRMMIRRKITDRVNTLAGFVQWDTDPYLVLGDDGRLVWIIDGYMTSSAHPYSREVEMENLGTFNYIRNSVKATIDAYDGTTHLYVFDEQDPLLNAYRNLFPKLFAPASSMPPDLRRHARYPEMIFSAQAEIYRLFHMRDPDTFYNKSDAWDIAKFTSSQGGQPSPAAPTYVVATLPGETKPEFLLLTPFTPRNRDNLIGMMIARCDGDHLGERVVVMLSKQEIILGPMQVEARINQDQNISKDLTLWNQQGSQVLRAQMLVLPIQHTFLYVEPIYIQASQAKMPQMKKVALAMGNELIYTDTYQEALAQLAGENAAGAPTPGPTPTTAPAPAGTVPAGNTPDARIVEIRRHLQRYRDLVSQGKLAEAGKELEAVQALVEK
jgi:uncharacterized membrane protein (UPF0182 family)